MSKLNSRFVLRKGADSLHRLKKTGVMDVTNPVQQALNEGRLQEIDEDSD